MEKVDRRRVKKNRFKQSAGSRDGAMSALIGIAARESIENGKIIRIEDLTDLKPVAQKG